MDIWCAPWRWARWRWDTWSPWWDGRWPASAQRPQGSCQRASGYSAPASKRISLGVVLCPELTPRLRRGIQPQKVSGFTAKTKKVPPRGVTFWVPNQGLLWVRRSPHNGRLVVRDELVVKDESQRASSYSAPASVRIVSQNIQNGGGGGCAGGSVPLRGCARAVLVWGGVSREHAIINHRRVSS